MKINALRTSLKTQYNVFTFSIFVFFGGVFDTATNYNNIQIWEGIVVDNNVQMV
jgi:hypothetical protein